jgi:hypothetical protein
MMQKILSLVCVALLSAGSLWAGAQKPSVELSLASERTIIVMDTTQSLLDDVKVQAGKLTFVTSFDGKVVLSAEQCSGAKKITFSKSGFEDYTLSAQDLASSDLHLIRMKPSALKPKKDDSSVKYSRGGTGKLSGYKTVSAAAVEDGIVYEEDAVLRELSAPMMASRPDLPMPSGAVAVNNAQAGMLTAGEVNDFAKWYFWPTVMDSTHAAFVGTWGIVPRQRFTVQVVNGQNYPVASYPVNLTDAKGNTLYQAITDNTGKAELWNGLIGANPAKADKLFVRVDDKKQEAKAWNTFVIDEPCQGQVADGQGSDVDVVFVFDATGSMGDELRYLQAEMKDVIARAKEATGGLAIRTGAVVYRDHGDAYITRISRLTDELGTTQAFIDKQYASGGGDYPEAVPEALMAALNSSGWNENARARIAFLVLDAPCHEDAKTLSLLHEQVLNAAALGVRIVPVVCSGLGESGEYLLRSIALATNGTSFFLTDDSGIGHSHLKPTTDSLKVEHLNDMLVRTIVEFSTMPKCNDGNEDNDGNDVNDQFVPNPFGPKELAQNPEIPHGEGVHYIVDISGKLIAVFEGDIDNYQLSIVNYQLPIGVYFIKTYIDGQWFTKKVLVR